MKCWNETECSENKANSWNADGKPSLEGALPTRMPDFLDLVMLVRSWLAGQRHGSKRVSHTRHGVPLAFVRAHVPQGTPLRNSLESPAPGDARSGLANRRATRHAATSSQPPSEPRCLRESVATARG
jgi:hypothetical protein